MERGYPAVGTDDASWSAERVRADGGDRGANRGLQFRADLGQRGERPVTGGGRLERNADGSASHRAAKPAGGGSRSGSRAGSGVGRRTVGTTGFCGRWWSEECVRTVRGGAVSYTHLRAHE